jgi:glycosyltransferase involved in cell wall biosynthesis
VRVVYYSHPAFFEPALCLTRELSQRAEVHLLLEVSPTAWQTAAFDVGKRPLPPGIHPADEILRDSFPSGVRDYWRSAASFHLVAHSSGRSLHPSSWRISRQALTFAVDLGADVLHIDDVDVSPRLALALPTFRRVPIVLAVHDPEPHSGERNWRKRLARRLAYPRAAKFVLYNAPFQAAFAARYRIAPSAIEVTRLGVYDVCAQWPSGTAGPPRTVLFFGRLSAYKGLDVFYDAARLVAERVAGVTFVVAGRPVEGYTPPPLPALPRGGAIQLIDRYLSNSDAAALFRSALVVVCPYRDATQSGVVLSAFAFGVPVIATAVGGLPEYVLPERTGLLVPPGDAPALSAAIERVVCDPALVGQLSRSIASAAAGEFHWRHTAEALVHTYQSAARHHPAPRRR